MNRRAPGVRRRLVVALLATAAPVLVGAVVAVSALVEGRVSEDATAAARSAARRVEARLIVRDGRVFATPSDLAETDALVWVFSGSRPLLDPPVAPAIRRVVRELATGPEEARSLASTRLYALPVSGDGGRAGTIVAAASIRPFKSAADATVRLAIVFGVGVFGAIALFGSLALRQGLRPVERMAADAATWSETDLSRRFGMGPPRDEIGRLAATLDGLLDRISASLRREQRVTAEISHELRTPLAAIVAETDLALGRNRSPEDYVAALGSIRESATEMTRAVEALLAAARAETGGGVVDIRGTVAATVELMRRRGQAAVALELTLPPEPVPVAASNELIAHLLQPLLDNALTYGRALAEVSVRREDATAVIEVCDDGPGIAQGEGERIFEPGARGGAADASPTGSGLGLALVRRLTEAAGGEVFAHPGSSGHFTVRLPIADPPRHTS